MNDDDGAIPDEEMGEWNTGPFCLHFSTPWDCEEVCSDPKCKHRCGKHGDNGECGEYMCECEGWTLDD